jgi:hypothetical protein
MKRTTVEHWKAPSNLSENNVMSTNKKIKTKLRLKSSQRSKTMSLILKFSKRPTTKLKTKS